MFELVPQNIAELMTIAFLTPDIVTVSFPFRRYGLLKIGGRGTIIRLSNHTIAVFSPPPLTPAVHAALQTLTESTSPTKSQTAYLIAPNAVHTLWLQDWHSAFPHALLIGPSTASAAHPSLPFDLTFPLQDSTTSSSPSPSPTTSSPDPSSAAAASDAFLSAFAVSFFGSHANELVLLHRASQTLLVADLIFNPPASQSYASPASAESASSGLLTCLFGRLRGLEGAPLERQRKIIGWIAGRKEEDRARFAESARVVKGWGVGRIVVCHGDVIEEGEACWEKLFGQFF